MTQFRKYGFNETNAQNFEKEKIFATKCGQKYNVYDAIQAAKVDTNINEVLEKYHCNEDTALEIMKQRGGIEGVYLDISQLQEQELKTTGDIFNLKRKYEEEFYNLPIKMREQFGNDPKTFVENAIKFAKEQKEKQIPNSENNKTNEGNNVNN